jgi:hypothetical protein
VTDAVCDRAVEVQRALAARGEHRGASIPDSLIAACAEAQGVAVLHYETDYDLIASVTGQPTQWVVCRAEVSRRTAVRGRLGARAVYVSYMSAGRDELVRLARELPESEVPRAVSELRSCLHRVAESPWPPAWFGAAPGRRRDTSERVDELLAEGFGE